MKKYIITLCITLLPLWALHAQDISPYATFDEGAFQELLQQEIILDIYPEHPQPHQSMTLEAENSLLDMERAYFEWYINGTLYESGVGKRSISATAGRAGERMEISVTARDLSNIEASTTEVIIPAAVDILWEADTYTPPFYKGKAISTVGSEVRLIAQPEIIDGGRRLPNTELFFEWSTGQGTNGDASGFGLNTYTLYTGEVYKEKRVSVTVSNFDKSIIAHKIFTSLPEYPQVVIYRESPLSGISFNNAVLKDFSLDISEKEVRLRAIPFFFANSYVENDRLEYEWNLGRNSASTERSVTLRRVGNSGTIGAELEVRYPDIFFQNQRKAFNITF